MSTPQKKIVIKASAPKQMPATPAANPLQQKKVVVKASAPAAPQKAAVQASPLLTQRKVVSASKKLVFAATEAEDETDAPKTRDEILMEALALLQTALGMSGGKRKGLKKDGTPRAKRVNNSGWNVFVKEFRAENPGMSWKDAMVAAKADWAALKGESASAEEEEEAPAPAPKKLVIAKSGAKTAPVPVVNPKAAAELMAEAMAEAEAEAEDASVECDEFEWEGLALMKNAEGFCWRMDEAGEQVFVGRWDAEKEEMDQKADEPSYGSA